jgi:hypothetical protein
MSDIIITPNRGSANAPTIQFSGSANASASIRLEVLPEGQVAFLGKSGSLFSISDNMVGSLMAVGDISGLPILEVFSNDKVVMGQFNKNTLVVTGSRVGVGKSNPTVALDVSGSIAITGSMVVSGAATFASTVTVGDNLAIGGASFPAWIGTPRLIQFGDDAIYGNSSAGGTLRMLSNLYYSSGGWKRRSAGYGTYLSLENASLGYSVAAYSGSADSVATLTEVFSIAQGTNAATFAGAVTVGGLLDLSAATAGQIKFPSGIGHYSANANTLDDYEEGTWTGTMTGGTTAPTTPVTATGKYTKIGNVVTVIIIFNDKDTTGAVGQLLVTGLPFTSTSSVINQMGSVAVYGLSIPNKTLNTWISSSSTTIEFISAADNGAWSFPNITAGANKYAHITATYLV